jgi:hypothetical protein
VVAVVALEAVIAREVALQSREDRDLQLVTVLAYVPEEVLETAPLRFTALDNEAVLNERVEGLALVVVESGSAGSNPLEQRRDVGRNQHLRVREGVHEEHLVTLGKRHLYVEHRGLHQIP